VTLAQDIAPGQSDMFLLRVASDLTARYLLDIELKSFERSLGHKRLRLEVFVPRSAAVDEKSPASATAPAASVPGRFSPSPPE
jgi:hypothetical protein